MVWTKADPAAALNTVLSALNSTHRPSFTVCQSRHNCHGHRCYELKRDQAEAKQCLELAKGFAKNLAEHHELEVFRLEMGLTQGEVEDVHAHFTLTKPSGGNQLVTFKRGAQALRAHASVMSQISEVLKVES